MSQTRFFSRGTDCNTRNYIHLGAYYAAPRATNLYLLLRHSQHPSTTRSPSLVLLTHCTAAFGDKRGRKGGRLDDDIDRPSASVRQCRRHLLSRLITSLVFPPPPPTTKTETAAAASTAAAARPLRLQTAASGKRGQEEGRRRRLRVPFPSAVKYIQEAFECVCAV